VPAETATADEYAINVAQTEFRDAVNLADPARANAILGEFVVWMRDGEPSYWGREGHRAATAWVKRMAGTRAKLTIIPDKCETYGDFAFCRGWEKVGLPEKELVSFRYFQAWERTSAGWRLTAFMTNKDVEPSLLD
jgi:ketosteroid isomerase-like protein